MLDNFPDCSKETFDCATDALSLALGALASYLCGGNDPDIIFAATTTATVKNLIFAGARKDMVEGGVIGLSAAMGAQFGNVTGHPLEEAIKNSGVLMTSYHLLKNAQANRANATSQPVNELRRRIIRPGGSLHDQGV